MSCPNTAIRPAAGLIKPMMVRRSTDLPVTRTADNAHDLAGLDPKIEAVVNDLGAELGAQAAHLDGRSGPSLAVGCPVLGVPDSGAVWSVAAFIRCPVWKR